MKPASPVIPSRSAPEIVFAKDQPQYRSLPALRTPSGDVLTRWRLSIRERLVVLFRGDVYLATMTFNQSLQPVLLQVERPLESCQHGFEMCGWSGRSSRLYNWLTSWKRYSYWKALRKAIER